MIGKYRARLRVPCSLACLLASGAPLAAQESAGQPKALLALEQYRSRHLRKCEIQWSLRPKKQASFSVMHYTSRFARDAQILLKRGDDEGVIGQTAEGKPVKGQFYSMIDDKGDMWRTPGTSAPISYYSSDCLKGQPSYFQDVRAIDLSMNAWKVRDVHTALWKPELAKHGRVTYEETTEGGLHVVTAKVRGPNGKDRRYIYRLDPKRGWSPIKIEHRVDGELRNDTRITLEKWSGVWFPATILRFRSSYEGGKEPYNRIDIHSVRFDPTMPDTFGPKDIGAEVGTNIGIAPTPDRPGHYLIWDGTKGIDKDEGSRKVASGELIRGPNFMRRITRGSSSGGSAAGRSERFVDEPVDAFQDEWERYVRAFIKEHELSEAQSDNAMAVLADCRKDAQRHVQSHRKEFDELRKLRDKVGELQEMKADATAARGRLRARQEELAKPLDTIFEQQLKPRLRSLLTAEQRKRIPPAKP